MQNGFCDCLRPIAPFFAFLRAFETNLTTAKLLTLMALELSKHYPKKPKVNIKSDGEAMKRETS